MPKRNLKNVEEYFQLCKDENKEVFLALFQSMVESLPDHTLSLKYGFPVLCGNGKMGFDERAKYIVIYFHHYNLSRAVEKYHEVLGPYKLEKESLRYKSPEDIPIQVLSKIAVELFR